MGVAVGGRDRRAYGCYVGHVCFACYARGAAQDGVGVGYEDWGGNQNVDYCARVCYIWYVSPVSRLPFFFFFLLRFRFILMYLGTSAHADR